MKYVSPVVELKVLMAMDVITASNDVVGEGGDIGTPDEEL